jgi:hypothetical protein
MDKVWEIRGLFGNEYAMETAIEELKKHDGFEYQVLDRRNLSIRLRRRDENLEGMIRRTIDIAHGFVESEAPLGDYDRMKHEVKLKKLKEIEQKKKRLAKH